MAKRKMRAAGHLWLGFAFPTTSADALAVGKIRSASASTGFLANLISLGRSAANAGVLWARSAADIIANGCATAAIQRI